MQEKDFILSRSAAKLFNRHMNAIRTGIANVSELRLRDSKPQSLSKAEFERVYIEKLLSAVVGAVSADIRGLVEVLSKQAQSDVEALAVAGEKKDITPQGNENIKEDN